MKKVYVYLLIVIVIITGFGVITRMMSNSTKQDQPEKREIWEYRTERYLDRVLTEANLAIHEAEEYYSKVSSKEPIDSGAVEYAGKAIETAKKNARTVISYRSLLNSPSSEWTTEDSAKLKNVYGCCRSIENEGWGYNIAARLVMCMEEKEQE